MDFHNGVEAVLGLIGVGGISFIAKLLWTGGKTVANIEGSLTSLASSLTEIKTNHLPHIEGKVDKLQDAFIEHLQAHGGK